MPDGGAVGIKEGPRPSVPEQNNKGLEQPKSPDFAEKAKAAGRKLLKTVRTEQNLPKTVKKVADGTAFTELPITEAKTPEQEIQTKMAELQKEVNAKLADGDITQEQADELIKNLDANPDMIDDVYGIVNSKSPADNYDDDGNFGYDDPDEHTIRKPLDIIGDDEVSPTFSDEELASWRNDIDTRIKQDDLDALDPQMTEPQQKEAKQRSRWLKALLMALKAGLITAGAAAAMAAVGSVGAANMAGNASRQQ